MFKRNKNSIDNVMLTSEEIDLALMLLNGYFKKTDNGVKLLELTANSDTDIELKELAKKLKITKEPLGEVVLYLIENIIDSNKTDINIINAILKMPYCRLLKESSDCGCNENFNVLQKIIKTIIASIEKICGDDHLNLALQVNKIVKYHPNIPLKLLAGIIEKIDESIMIYTGTLAILFSLDKKSKEILLRTELLLEVNSIIDTGIIPIYVVHSKLSNDPSVKIKSDLILELITESPKASVKLLASVLSTAVWLNSPDTNEKLNIMLKNIQQHSRLDLIKTIRYANGNSLLHLAVAVVNLFAIDFILINGLAITQDVNHQNLTPLEYMYVLMKKRAISVKDMHAIKLLFKIHRTPSLLPEWIGVKENIQKLETLQKNSEDSYQYAYNCTAVSSELNVPVQVIDLALSVKLGVYNRSIIISKVESQEELEYLSYAISMLILAKVNHIPNDVAFLILDYYNKGYCLNLNDNSKKDLKKMAVIVVEDVCQSVEFKKFICKVPFFKHIDEFNCENFGFLPQGMLRFSGESPVPVTTGTLTKTTAAVNKHSHMCSYKLY